MEWVLEVYTVHDFGKDTHTLHHTQRTIEFDLLFSTQEKREVRIIVIKVRELSF